MLQRPMLPSGMASNRREKRASQHRPSIVIPLMNAANPLLVATTWGSYGTAERHIARVEKATGCRFSMPFSLQSTMAGCSPRPRGGAPGAAGGVPAKAVAVYVGFLLTPRSEGGRELNEKS